jgi:hypothetical protein
MKSYTFCIRKGICGDMSSIRCQALGKPVRLCQYGIGDSRVEGFVPQTQIGGYRQRKDVKVRTGYKMAESRKIMNFSVQ